MIIDELVSEYIIDNNSSTNIEAYKAGFTKCVEIIEETFKNKQIMLSLRAILENNKTVVVTRTRNVNAPDMVIEVKEGKTLITLSQSYFDKADLQNNKIMCVFEPGDHKVYFIVHNDEALYSDFMNGKRLALKDEEGKDVMDSAGKKVYADKIGIKSKSFQDKKTSQDLTLTELLEKVTVLDVKTEFNLNNKAISSLFTDANEFVVTSVWEVQNKKDVVITVTEDETQGIQSFEQEEIENVQDQTEELEAALADVSPTYNSIPVAELF